MQLNKFTAIRLLAINLMKAEKKKMNSQFNQLFCTTKDSSHRKCIATIYHYPHGTIESFYTLCKLIEYIFNNEFKRKLHILISMNISLT
jgi:hypothetical protein